MSEFAKLPTTSCWFRYDYLGLPKDLASKKLLYIELSPDEKIYNLGVNGAHVADRNVSKYFEEYPYDLTIINRHELLQELGQSNLTDSYDYILRWGREEGKYEGFAHNLILENLRIGKRYCAKFKDAGFSHVAKNFLHAVKNFLGAISHNPYPRNSENYCHRNYQTGELRSAFTDCPEADYLGFPEDLCEKGLIYIEAGKWDKGNAKSINSRVRKALEKRYPHSAKVVSAKSLDSTQEYGY